MSNLNKSKRVLIIEDDFGIRETLKESLQLEGYDVITAENGQEGLDKLSVGHNVGLILLDLMMPIMSGEQFLKAIGENIGLSEIPIIVVSATANPHLRGIRSIIRKPPDMDLLLKKVADFY